MLILCLWLDLIPFINKVMTNDYLRNTIII